MTLQAPEHHGGNASPIHRLDPRAKIIAFTGAILVCVSTPANGFASFAGYFLFAAILLLLAKVPSSSVGMRMLALLPFAAMSALFIPFLAPDSPGGGYRLGVGGLHLSHAGLLVFWNAMVKAAFGAFCITLLSATTPFPDLLRGLERIKTPRMITLLAGFTYRYLFVLKEEALRMKRARDSRGYRGRWLWQAAVAGQMIGALFLRSYERGERVYLAMASRGFAWNEPATVGTPMRGADWLFLALAAVWLIAFREAA